MRNPLPSSPVLLSVGLALAIGFLSCAKDPPQGVVTGGSGGATGASTGGAGTPGSGGRTGTAGSTGTGCIAALGVPGTGGMKSATGGAGGTQAGGGGGASVGGASAGGANAGGSSAGGSNGGGGTSAGGSGEGGSAGGAGAGGASADALSSRSPVAADAPALPWLHVEGNKIKDANGDVVILRGVAFPDLGELQLQEAPAGSAGAGIKAMIDRVTRSDDTEGGCSASWATRVIRLALSPADGMAKTPLQYLPGGTYYDTVLRPTVDYARQKGLYVIIDWHYIDDTTKHQDTTTAFWMDMAPRFANDSNVLFELYNEPINAGSWATVKADMQTWYNAVRQSAPDNLVLVGTPNWSQLVGTAAASPIDGSNIVYVAHMYPQHWANSALRTQITQAAAKVPVFVTEWGFQQDPTNSILNGTITSYGAPFKQFLQQTGASWTAWCASRSWQPAMFNSDFTLTYGEGAMGGFVKDWLYEQQDVDQVMP